jgi:hypothetical protein
MFPSEKYPTEADPVQGCREHQEDAWQILYYHYCGPLALAIVRLLGFGKQNWGLAEELAHDVLSSLVENDYYRLRVFDSRRCCLRVYLGRLALQRVQLRHRLSRRHREVPLGAHEPSDTGLTIEFLEACLRALEPTLTPQERRFFRQELLGQPLPEGPYVFSPANAEKLHQRVRRKLLAVLAR